MAQQTQVNFEEYTQGETNQWAQETSATVSSPPASETDRTVPAAFLCPLTLDIMREPVMDRNGHTYEKRAILEWLERGNEACPLTRNRMRMSDLVPNSSLQRRIQDWRREQGEDLCTTEEDDEEEFDRPFVGIINLPLELQEKLGDMESALQLRARRSITSDGTATMTWVNHEGYPIVFYYIPDDEHILELIDSATHQRLTEECIAEERCLAMTYVALLCSLFLLFAIVIFILYQLLLDNR